MTDGPKPKVRVIGLAAIDDQGRLIVLPGKVAFDLSERQPTRKGGAPRKYARDVAMTLHFEFMTLHDRYKKGIARDELAALFELQDPKDVSAIVKRTRTQYLGDGPRLFQEGVQERDGTIDGRLFIALDSPSGIIKESGTLRLDGKGFIVRWHDTKAHYGHISTPPVRQMSV